MAEHDPRCMTLTSDEFADVCDCWILRGLARFVATGELPPLGHFFTPVAGRSDGECTYCSDGTDATYCGEPLAAHESGGADRG